MKTALTIILSLITFITYTQCDNGTNYYPSFIYTPTVDTWDWASTCNWAGEVIQLNITSGDSYQFSTCGERGGVQASYDTQITLRDGSGALLAYNDDFTGCSGFTSYLYWTATYTGVLYVHLNEYYCASNFICTQVMIYRSEPIGLPITLSFFDAYHLDETQDKVEIKWITQSEQNNDYFTLYKSYDGYEWNQLQKIQGAGYSNTELTYTTQDNNPRPGVQYYKLRQTDYDEQWEEFDAVVINNKQRSIIVKYVNILGQDVSMDTPGLILAVYADGSTRKIVQ